MVPDVTNSSLFSSPNGFNSTLEMNGTDPNTWCIKGSGWRQIINTFKGWNNYTVKVSVNLADQSKCTLGFTDSIFIMFDDFSDNSHVLTFSRNYPADSTEIYETT